MMPLLPPLPCYLNGSFTVLPDAKVSVMDRGFVFGDGIYEVVPVYRGIPFRFDAHMARLERSLNEVRIPNPLRTEQWRDVVQELVERYARSAGTSAPIEDQLVYIQVTRGVAMRDHAMPEHIEPTVFAMTNSLPAVSAQQRARGVACVSAMDFRWEKAHIKCTSLLGAVLARQISVNAGAVETVMFRDNYLSEAAASNVWVVKNGAVFGPPLDNLVLEGVRYSVLQEICNFNDIPWSLRRIHRNEVLAADELLLSNASKEILAITSLDGNPVGCGAPGPVYKCLYAGYQSLKYPETPNARSDQSAPPDSMPDSPPPVEPMPATATESLIEYPSQFPIKVMGIRSDDLVAAITHIAHQFDPAFDATTIALRQSKGGKYLGVTITITATSRAQLDELYRTLSTHPMVKVVL